MGCDGSVGPNRGLAQNKDALPESIAMAIHERVIATISESRCEAFSTERPIDAFIINMESASSRWGALQTQIDSGIAHSGIRFNRYPAVDGSLKPPHLYQFSKGQWGCFQSHAQILKYSRQREHSILTMEDDEVITARARYAPALTRLATEIDPHWDVIYLDATLVHQAEIREFAAIAKYSAENRLVSLVSVKPADRIFGCHAYITNSKSIGRLADLLERLTPQEKAVDNCFVALAEAGLLRCYIALPLPMYGSTESMVSQIGTPSDQRYDAWLAIRKGLAATGSPSDIINEVDQGLSIHSRLFGDGIFGHFVKTDAL